jgi:para-aminobenzoate synthetase component I
MSVGIYDWAVLVDHEQQASWLVGAGRDAATARPGTNWSRCSANRRYAQTPRGGRSRVGKVSCNFSRQTYRQAFARIQRYISAGDCYQVNLAQRFSPRRSAATPGWPIRPCAGSIRRPTRPT